MAINTVEDLYREILGREPDAGGKAFWEQGFGNTIDPTEIASFTQAAQSELANRPAAEQALLAPKVVNPTATGVSDADILGWFNANPGADDATIARVMKEAAVTPEQVARATNTNYEDVNNRYLAATSGTPGGITDLVKPTSADVVKPTFTEPVKYEPPALETTHVSEWNAPVDLGNGTFMTPGGTIIDKDGRPVTQATTATDTAASNAYFKANPSVAAAYAADSQGMTPDEYAQHHYIVSGAADEGALSPAQLNFQSSNTFKNAIDLKNGLFLTPDGRAFYSDGREEKNWHALDTSVIGNENLAKLTKQIIGQGTTSQWTGEGWGSKEANAAAISSALLTAHITDLKDFGKVAEYQPVQVIGQKYNGNDVYTISDDNGNPLYKYYMKPGAGEDSGEMVLIPAGAKVDDIYGGYDAETGGLAPIDPSKVTKDAKGNLVVATGGTTWGNTKTGEAIAKNFDAQTGANVVSGTTAGDGNTAFRVDMSTGKPIFYTTYKTSNTLANLVSENPLLNTIANAAAAYFGGPLGVAALQAAEGKSATDIAKAAILTYVGGEVAQGVGGSEALVNSVGVDAAKVIGNAAGKFVSSEGKADIVASLVGGAIDVGVDKILTNIPDFENLTKFEKDFTKNVVRTTIQNGGDLSFDQLANAALTAGIAAAKASKTGAVAQSIAANTAIDDAVTAASSSDVVGTLRNSGAVEGTQLASLDSNTASDAGNGFTLTGAGGETLNLDDFSGSDGVAADAALFNSSIGDLDAAGTDTAAGGTDLLDWYDNGSITDTTGLDLGDVITSNVGGDNVDELVVTGKGNGTDTTTDTTTDTSTDLTDFGKVVVKGKRGGDACPVGTQLNPETGECDPYWDEGSGDVCGPGMILDPSTGMCVVDQGTVVVKAKAESCPVGTKLNPETGECDPYWDEGGGDVCGVGEHLDPATGMCVPNAVEAVTCEAGFHLGPDGKTCVPDELDTTECAEGFHLENGICVADDDTKVDTECPEGYLRNTETGACEKIDTITCPVGYTLKGGKCVPIVVTPPPPPPPPPPPKTCPVGYKLVNGACVPIATAATPTSVAGGEGERTDPIYAGGMDEFNLLATLQELLAEDGGKTDKKKDSKKSKDKTKMATGGHLDDLLAEQITVDDLLKILR